MEISVKSVPTGLIGNQCKLYIESTQPNGFHWRPMQSIRTKYPEPTRFVGDQCKLYLGFIYLENTQPTGFHWISVQSMYTQRTIRANWIPLEVSAKYIPIKHSESTGFHWISMQSIRRKSPEPTGFIGNQCKLYIDFIYLENTQPSVFHWRSMQSIYT